ncbi:MAG: hypothetical protein C5B50_13500 [Verrucomicrobia bacterium]|nr:MAG: hypothetical protein C5B50_13500 [Verrucomicrobiota bacterium]
MLFALSFCLLISGCGSKKVALDPDLARAVAEKKALAKQFAIGETNPIPSDTWKFFDLLERGDWHGATNAYRRIWQPNYLVAPDNIGGELLEWFRRQYGWREPLSGLNAPLCSSISETMGIAQCFHDWDPELLHRFGRDIIESIPTDSIYFGGMTAGHFIVTALSGSYQGGRPFYILNQNVLDHEAYRKYLGRVYGTKIYVPNERDITNAFQDEAQSFTERMRSQQITPAKAISNGTVTAISVISEMQIGVINGFLVERMAQANPGHEVFVEESFRTDWHPYAYLVPHGLIFKLEPQPLAKLDDAIVRKDHEYWKLYTAQLIGDWLTEDTSMKQVCEFADKVYSRKDLSGFTGNKTFARNSAAQKAYAKLRVAIAVLYAWRAEHAATNEERNAMEKEANYAFRQAVALCPWSAEVVGRTVDYLGGTRPEDASLITQTRQRLTPTNCQAVPFLPDD